MTRNFSLQSNAQTVAHRRIYRDEHDGEIIACHISVDPRLARGSVYAHHKLATDTVKPIRYKPKPIPKWVEPHEANYCEEDTPDIRELEPELLEIEDRPIEDDLATAAETYIERPPTPLFVEEEKGIDVETQVGPKDLFDFDSEVYPVLKVIVQHTLLRALSEVHEEVELENIRRHRDVYEAERNSILAELQRREAKAKRLADEIKRRNEQRKAVKKEIRELNRKIATRGFADFYATDVVLHAMDLLEERGLFYDEVEREISDVFLPWLSGEIANALACKEYLKKLEEKSIEKADEMVQGQKERLRNGFEVRHDIDFDRNRNALRIMLIEDRAGESIRRAMDAYEARKREQNKNNNAEEETVDPSTAEE